MNPKDGERVVLTDLKVGTAYKLEARNIRVGIWDGENFHGIRHKFGQRFMDAEVHYDLDDHYGTAVAVAELTE